MRKFRVPTIPNMGMFVSQREGVPFQTCDSAIFADAEEESPRPEQRPSAPRFSGLRRKNPNHEQSRFMDANQNENYAEKRPSATMRFRALKSLSSTKEVHAGDLKEHHDESQLSMIQDFTTEAYDSKNPLESEVTHYRESQVTSGSVVCEPPLNSEGNCPRQDTISCQTDQHQTEQMNDTMQTEDGSSSDLNVSITQDVTLATRLPHVDVLKQFRKVVENVRTWQHRISQHTVPRLHERTRLGWAIVVTNLTVVFNFLAWCLENVFNVFTAIEVQRILGATETDKAPVLTNITEERPSVTLADTVSRETDSEENVGELLRSDKTNVPTVLSPLGIDHNQKAGEKLCSAPSSHKYTRLNSKLRLDPPASAPASAPVSTDVKNFGTLGSDMTEEMMTAVPRIPSFNRKSNYIFKEDKTAFKEEKNTGRNHCEGGDSASKIESQSISDGSSQRGFSGNVADAEPSTETLSQGRSSAENLMNELDASSMRFEHKDSEIIISPLEPTSPTFLSEGEYATENRRRMKHPSGDGRNPAQPVRLSTEQHELGTYPGKKRNPRGPTGKLKTDMRTMKGSIFRIFGRNKLEPETRFASPRSARKTLTLIADVLVKEHGCDVAVRRNGALKMRCEKIFTGNQRLKVRLAFQPMDAYSCNVTICRSREDDLQISTTDYVNFVADVQRSFLNATSEGMLGTRGSN